jgi:hypothetical protein
MVWYGIVWYGIVWYGIVWYGIVMYKNFKNLFCLKVNWMTVCWIKKLFRLILNKNSNELKLIM